MKKLFTITQVKPRIFFFDFKNQYDCNMTFLRFQEYYESPSRKFRGKNFQILDFMEWYSKEYGKGAFTYPIDWGGFNIPAHVIPDLYNRILDYNQYDHAMYQAYIKCSLKVGRITKDPKFYIIGAVGTGGALKHEIAHGFFYTQPEYKKEMSKLVNELKPSFRNSMYNTLDKIGYTPKVFVDECQAYLATGLTESFEVKLKNEHKPFVALYKAFYDA